MHVRVCTESTDYVIAYQGFPHVAVESLGCYHMCMTSGRRYLIGRGCEAAQWVSICSLLSHRVIATYVHEH